MEVKRGRPKGRATRKRAQITAKQYRDLWYEQHYRQSFLLQECGGGCRIIKKRLGNV